MYNIFVTELSDNFDKLHTAGISGKKFADRVFSGIGSIEIANAFLFAAEIHENHKRKTTKEGEKLDYIIHPLVAYKILNEVLNNESVINDHSKRIILISSILHDTIEEHNKSTSEDINSEEKPLTHQILKTEFGQEIADTVLLLTPYKYVAKQDKNQKKELDKKGDSIESLIVRTGDRIANLTGLLEEAPQDISVGVIKNMVKETDIIVDKTYHLNLFELHKFATIVKKQVSRVYNLPEGQRAVGHNSLKLNFPLIHKKSGSWAKEQENRISGDMMNYSIK